MKRYFFTVVCLLISLAMAAQSGLSNRAPANVEAVDLGLPSGTKWANMNVGASCPEDYGKYFAWGETLPKNSYTWENYMCSEKTCGKLGDPVYDLVGDKADIAGTKFDAAKMNWGESWNMPTAEQVEELASNCYSSLVTINGVKCRKLRSKINGNEIIFPLAGARWYESFAYEGTLCYYWGSTLRQGGYVSPCRFIVREHDHGWGWSMGGENDRFCGYPIRPVFIENSSTNDTIAYHKFSVAFNDDMQEKYGYGVRFQRNGNSDGYSLSIDDQQGNEATFDISKISYITRKSIGQFSLPEASGISVNDITITVDGDTISMDDNGNYDAVGSTLVATNAEGEIVYMNIASVEDGTDAVGADLNAKESALTLMLPLVPNIFVEFDDEYLPKLKEMIWDVPEVKQLAAAIDRSVAKYGYTDFGEIRQEATAARNKISQLLHLDKIAERQAESASSASRKSMLKASGSTESPYLVNPYGFFGLEVEITDSEEKQFYLPYIISGYNCDVTAYNYNRFAYSSMVKGKYNADTNTYNVPDLGNGYDYYKNILKPQKVSTFMNTFTSFKYEDLERLGQFLEETFDPNISVSEMHWSDEKKTANFDISEQDDAIVLLFPRGSAYMMVYNILQSIVKPIFKFISKEAAKEWDSDVFIPLICEKMLNDPNYILEVGRALNDSDLSTFDKIETITSVSWTQFFKAVDKLGQDKLDDTIKKFFTNFVNETAGKVGGKEMVDNWNIVKKHFKALNWIKKYGDILTGTIGLFKEDNAVYPVHWEAKGQFALAQSEATVGEGESIKVRVIVGSNSYRCESSDEKIATVKSNHDKIEITGVDAGRTIITVRDIIAQKTEKITVDVTGIQTFALASSSVSVPVYEDRSVAIERGDGPFHIFGGDEKIAIAKISNKAVVVSGVSEGSTTFQVYNGATNQFLPLIVKVTAETVTISDERIVDLGLSVNWANCNVGASEPQEYGDYFAWGEVDSKDYFSANNYEFYSNGKFVDIGSDISGTKYDAATHNMGDYWRMPTKAEYEELINKCAWKFVTYRRVRGWKVIGPNGNSIFLPVAGYMLNDWNDDVAIYGHYWSSNITDNHREVYTLYASMSNYKMAYGYMNCFEGRSIRAVTGAGSVSLNLQLSTTSLTLTPGSQGKVDVTSGSGSYAAVSNATNVATVTVDGSKIIIKAVAPGSATITVKDNKTQEREKIEVTVTEVGASIKVEPLAINFGEVAVGLSKSDKFIVKNVSNEKVKFTVQDTHGEIEIYDSGQEFTLASGEEKTFIVSYRPTTINNGFNTRVYIDTDKNEREQYIDISGSAISPNYNSVELIFNGDFSLGAVGFTSDYDYVSETGSRALWNEGKYSVGTCPRDYHYDFLNNGDHTNGKGNMLIVNGSIDNSKYVWKQSVYVEKGKTYEFSAWFISVSGHGSAKKENIEYYINGTVNLGNYDKNENGWDRYYWRYTATETGPILLKIRTMSADAGGNDFAIDDISFTSDLSSIPYYLSCPDDHHPHMIDLGLPSGTKWACCNLDYDTSKQNPSNIGSCFAWGQTDENTDYLNNNFSDIAGTVYDVAHIKWGGNWVIPNNNQINELFRNCTSEKTSLNGVNGLLLTSSNKQSIFIPDCDYWSSQHHDMVNTAYYWNAGILDKGYVSKSGSPISFKYIRPVSR